MSVEGADSTRWAQDAGDDTPATVGYVFQVLNLIRGLTAVENVALPPSWTGERARGEETGGRPLDEVGLSAGDGPIPGPMSGGEQQRVAIARALVGRAV